jgi:hypothetical protein
MSENMPTAPTAPTAPTTPTTVPLAGTNLCFPESSPLSQLDMKQFTADIEEIREFAKTIPAEARWPT